MIKNFYTATEAEPGDIFVCVVTCHISEMGYRTYRCAWPPQMGGGDVPRGSAMFDTSEVVKQLFPIVSDLGIKERI